MVSRALHAAGLRVGRYTSPHLVHLHERFAIDDVDVADDARSMPRCKRCSTPRPRCSPPAQLAGPGHVLRIDDGRGLRDLPCRRACRSPSSRSASADGHDATNVVTAPYAAITSIGFDHMAQLGGTLAQIAREKAGVIVPGATVVSGVIDARARRGHRRTSAQRRAPASFAPTRTRRSTSTMQGGETTVRLRTPFRAYGPVRLALRGAHQVANAVVAVRLLEALEFAGIGGGRRRSRRASPMRPGPDGSNGGHSRTAFPLSSTAPTTLPAPKRSLDGCATRNSGR